MLIKRLFTTRFVNRVRRITRRINDVRALMRREGEVATATFIAREEKL